MANFFAPATIRRIVTFVTNNPGCSRSDIAKSLKINTAEVGKALADLKAAGTLDSTGSKRGTRWHVPTLRERIVKTVETAGRSGVSRSYVMESLGLGEDMGTHVTYILGTLTKVGALIRGGAKKGTRYFPQWA